MLRQDGRLLQSGKPLEIGGNSLPPLKEPVTDFSLLFERAPLLESLRVPARERVWLSCYRIDRPCR
jgi:hypothetical protein